MYTSGLKDKSKSKSTGAYSRVSGIDCGSPTNWFCPANDSPGQGRNPSRGVDSSRSTNRSASDLHATYSRLSLSASSKNVFRSDSEDDDEEDLVSDNGVIPTAGNNKGLLYTSNNFANRRSTGQFSDSGMIDVPPVTLNSLSSTHRDSLLTILPTNESRIIAPNVSKLSPNSAVEIRLQSPKECVAVLCSVDVLKMRSGFFHDVLSQQDKARFVQKSTAARASTVAAGSGVPGAGNTSAMSSVASASHHNAHSSDLLWRDAITVPEANPFEAAAYLESLHEGRALFRGEWNHSWARLSVSWVIEDLMLEYSSQIDQHMRKMMDTIHDNHWRTNPNVLAGMRVAVFRKSANVTPTIVTGVAAECLSNIGYSKLRVTFDGATSAAPKKPDSESLLCFGNPSANNSNTAKSAAAPDGYSALSTPTLTTSKLVNPFAEPTSHQPPQQQLQQQPIVGDISEPFWVQDTSENSVWSDPDELFLLESKRLITPTDKRVFWEMARSILDLPELHQQLSAGYIRSAADLAAVLKRPEFRVLWTPEAPEYIPKDIATELIAAAYVNSSVVDSRP